MPTLELVQRQSSSSSAPASPVNAALPRQVHASFLQRVTDGAFDSGDASLAASAPSKSAEAQPVAGNRNESREAPDLERLANEVYAIIERRIEVERESLGL